jgi:hypothetical protein
MKPFFACLILAVGLMTGTVEAQAAHMAGRGGILAEVGRRRAALPRLHFLSNGF